MLNIVDGPDIKINKDIVHGREIQKCCYRPRSYGEVRTFSYMFVHLATHLRRVTTKKIHIILTLCSHP